VAPGDLSREQLVALVERIRKADDIEQDWLVGRFEANVLHPRASTFIFFPEYELGAEYEGKVLSAEEVVEHVLAYKPIELGSAE
jgi:hypothetical protein